MVLTTFGSIASLLMATSDVAPQSISAYHLADQSRRVGPPPSRRRRHNRRIANALQRPTKLALGWRHRAQARRVRTTIGSRRKAVGDLHPNGLATMWVAIISPSLCRLIYFCLFTPVQCFLLHKWPRWWARGISTTLRLDRNTNRRICSAPAGFRGRPGAVRPNPCAVVGALAETLALAGCADVDWSSPQAWFAKPFDATGKKGGYTISGTAGDQTATAPDCAERVVNSNGSCPAPAVAPAPPPAPGQALASPAPAADIAHCWAAALRSA